VQYLWRRQSTYPKLRLQRERVGQQVPRPGEPYRPGDMIRVSVTFPNNLRPPDPDGPVKVEVQRRLLDKLGIRQLLAIVGGLLGCLIALPMNGFTAVTGTNAFSELAFAFKVTPQLLIIGLIFAVLMGIAGGLLPALRASRMPITRALREA